MRATVRIRKVPALTKQTRPETPSESLGHTRSDHGHMQTFWPARPRDPQHKSNDTHLQLRMSCRLRVAALAAISARSALPLGSLFRCGRSSFAAAKPLQMRIMQQPVERLREVDGAGGAGVHGGLRGLRAARVARASTV